MKKYLFLIAWMAHSDGACGEDTGVDKRNDLYPQYQKGNDHITAWEIEAENEEAALDKGYRKAFMSNFTAHDTFSDLICLEE